MQLIIIGVLAVVSIVLTVALCVQSNWITKGGFIQAEESSTAGIDKHWENELEKAKKDYWQEKAELQQQIRELKRVHIEQSQLEKHLYNLISDYNVMKSELNVTGYRAGNVTMDNSASEKLYVLNQVTSDLVRLITKDDK